VYARVDDNFPVGENVCAKGFKFGRCEDTGATIVYDRNAHMGFNKSGQAANLPKPAWCYAAEAQDIVAQVWTCLLTSFCGTALERHNHEVIV
jgi:hypothetical protein